MLFQSTRQKIYILEARTTGGDNELYKLSWRIDYVSRTNLGLGYTVFAVIAVSNRSLGRYNQPPGSIAITILEQKLQGGLLRSLPLRLRKGTNLW